MVCGPVCVRSISLKKRCPFRSLYENECSINPFSRQTHKEIDPLKRSIVGPCESETGVGKEGGYGNDYMFFLSHPSLLSPRSLSLSYVNSPHLYICFYITYLLVELR